MENNKEKAPADVKTNTTEQLALMMPDAVVEPKIIDELLEVLKSLSETEKQTIQN